MAIIVQSEPKKCSFVNLLERVPKIAVDLWIHKYFFAPVCNKELSYLQNNLRDLLPV